MSDIDAAFTRVCESYKKAVYEKDAGAFLHLYDQDARVFDTWAVWSYEGVTERRKIVEQWFASLGEERVAVTIDRIQVAGNTELAMLSARAIYAAISSRGEELRSMQNRLTWVLKFEAGAWKIIHEHTSVSIGPDLKGLLQRD
jgi:uncharacterized protein (TIGR02246 family)